MKNSAVLASMLFGALAVAAPLDPRRLVYKTQVVTETVVVYTTIYDDEPVAQATTTRAGNFYEHPKKPSSVAAVVSSSQAPAYTPPVVNSPSVVASSTYVAPSSQAPIPTPTPAPAPVETSKPVESPQPVETPQPATSSAYVAPAPAPVVSSVVPAPPASSAAPAPPAATTPVTSTPTDGEKFSNVDITIYDNNGGFGACGTALYDTDMIVALAQPAWGASTYDVMTGDATNPWCGQKIKVEYNGNSIDATIMDLCPGCAGHDIDLSLAAWKALTGLDEKTRLKASWSKIA